MAKLTPRATIIMLSVIALTFMLFILREEHKKPAPVQAAAEQKATIEKPPAPIEWPKTGFDTDGGGYFTKKIEDASDVEIKENLQDQDRNQEFSLSPSANEVIEMKKKGVRTY